MSKRKIYDFLRELTDNNSKRWMDNHREDYEEAKQIWIAECDRILNALAGEDDFYADVEARDTIERINNNLLYHSEKPTYKDHFGFSPGAYKGTGLYVSVSPSYSFIGGGVHNPDNDMLGRIRKRIDKKGEQLTAVIEDQSFRQYFGGGLEDDPKAQKTSPRGYPRDHPHIDLLRRKNFTVGKRITQEEVLADDFPQTVAAAYRKMEPLLKFMREALG
jgi:uncharacterized protein (TIGR02453 family)